MKLKQRLKVIGGVAVVVFLAGLGYHQLFRAAYYGVIESGFPGTFHANFRDNPGWFVVGVVTWGTMSLGSTAAAIFAWRSSQREKRRLARKFNAPPLVDETHTSSRDTR